MNSLLVFLLLVCLPLQASAPGGPLHHRPPGHLHGQRGEQDPGAEGAVQHPAAQPADPGQEELLLLARSVEPGALEGRRRNLCVQLPVEMSQHWVGANVNLCYVAKANIAKA